MHILFLDGPLLDRQSVDPDRERIAAPGIKRETEASDMAQIDLAGVLARPFGISSQWQLHGHPGPPCLAEREIAEKVSSLGRFDFHSAILAVEPKHRSGILKAREVWIDRLDPKAH